MVGANFTGADLSKNSTADEATDFTGAYLQGAVFTNATVTDANFTNSYWDLTGSAALSILMQSANLQFTGYWNDPSVPENVEAIYPGFFGSTVTPTTSLSNSCPDGGLGPCDTVWESPRLPIDEAIPMSTVCPSSGCTDTDILWSFDLSN